MGLETKLEVNEIPLIVIDNHHEVLPHWFQHKDSSLLHIDAHSDMLDEIENMPVKRLEYETTVSTFICPSVHYGVIGSMYWYNPHSNSRRLQDMGSTDKNDERPNIHTIVNDGWIEWENRKLESGYGEIISPERITLSAPFILDVDLDAFCCKNHVDFGPDSDFKESRYEVNNGSIIVHNAQGTKRYYGVDNFEQRIDTTKEFLLGVYSNTGIRPSLITMARSQGIGEFVPSGKVDDVQARTIAMLRQVYQV